MKKIFIIFIGGLVTSLSAIAQETYENARISDNDLNGTARYVGMGGAMDALGADISTMSPIRQEPRCFVVRQPASREDLSCRAEQKNSLKERKRR